MNLPANKPVDPEHQVGLPGASGGSVQQAVDECERELNVRRRCFPRWVSEGRMSASDARDRLTRLATAVHLLRKVLALADDPDAVVDLNEPGAGEA